MKDLNKLPGFQRVSKRTFMKANFKQTNEVVITDDEEHVEFLTPHASSHQQLTLFEAQKIKILQEIAEKKAELTIIEGRIKSIKK